MNTRARTRPTIFAFVAAATLLSHGPVSLAAQQPAGMPPGEVILDRCSVAAGAGDESAANAAAQRADSLAKTLDAEQPVEAIVLRALTLG
jgi:hypothetical protein